MSLNKTYNNPSSITNSIMKDLLINKNNSLNGNKKYNSLTSVSGDKSPFLIIKYGPPASGKSSENVQKEIENLKLDIKDCIVFEIDRIIESLKNFRSESYSVYKNSDKSNNNKMKELSRIYFTKRQNKKINSDNSIDKKFENLIVTAIRDRKNIIFETTGGLFNDYNPIKWLFDIVNNNKKEDELPYYIALIYPILPENLIIERVIKRSKEQVKRNPPFYRAMSEDNLKEQIINAKNNFTFYIVNMLLYQFKIDKIIAFKNY